jgi:dihydroflavonol-4-reductase
VRFVLTGGTGFVGGVLARQLREAGHDVDALVRDRARAEHLRDLGASVTEAELTDRAVTARAAQGADGLFHVAGWYKVGSRDRATAYATNVEGTAAVLGAARDAGVPKIVYTSTLAVNSDTRGWVVDESYRFNGRHLSVYDESKAAAHDLVQRLAADGLPVVTVMPSVIYGPGDTSQTGAMIEQTARGRGRPLVPRGGGYCWAHVEDIARGHVLAMERGRPGESYMLAGPIAGLDKVLELVASTAHTDPPRTAPARVVRGTATVLRGLGALGFPVGAPAESLGASVASYLGTPAKAQSELHWSARPIETGITDLVGELLRDR